MSPQASSRTEEGQARDSEGASREAVLKGRKSRSHDWRQTSSFLKQCAAEEGGAMRARTLPTKMQIPPKRSVAGCDRPFNPVFRCWQSTSVGPLDTSRPGRMECQCCADELGIQVLPKKLLTATMIGRIIPGSFVGPDDRSLILARIQPDKYLASCRAQ